jgi:hypothetical protein
MYRLTLKYIFLISMCLSFYTHILIENSGQSYIWKTVSFILKTTFYTEGSTKHDLRLLVGNPAVLRNFKIQYIYVNRNSRKSN